MASQNSSSEFVAVYCGCRILSPSEDQTFGESLMGKCCLIQVSKTICWILSFFFLFEPISPEWRSNCRRKLWWSRVTMSALQEPRDWSRNSTCLARLVLYHCLCLCFSFCPYDTFPKTGGLWTGEIQLLHHLSQSFEDLVISDMQWRWTENFIPLTLYLGPLYNTVVETDWGISYTQRPRNAPYTPKEDYLILIA
jgi:hypothetical protein